MASSYGYKGQIGWGKETTYDTVPTITDFAQFVSETVHRESTFAISPLIRGNRRVPVKADRRLRRNTVTGSISMIALLEDQLKLWKAAIGTGASVLNTADSTTHTITPADTLDSLSFEIGRDAQVFKYSGCKINALHFVCDTANDFCTLDLDITGSGTVATAASPTSATYSSAQKLWIPTDAAFTIGGSAAEIRRFTMDLTNSFNDGDGSYSFNSERQRLDEVGRREITGEIVMAFSSVTEWAKIAAETDVAAVLTLTGAVIETGFSETLKIELPAIRYDGDDPQDSGINDEIVQSLKYRALYDGSSDEVTVTIINTETAI